MKKSTLILGAAAVLILSGCSWGKKTTSQPSEETSQTTTIKSTQTTSETKAKSTVETTAKTQSQSTSQSISESMRTSTSQSETPATSQAAYPYEVPASDLGNQATFHFTGMNVPESMTLALNGADGTVAFNYGGGRQNTYNAHYQNVPTQTIRVFSAGDNSVRSVEVNTAITMGSLVSGDATREAGGTLYLFKNNNGGISLATPNYAGNVPEDQRNVMLEVLQ